MAKKNSAQPSTQPQAHALSTYKGEPALTLENHALKVVVLPRRGAKIASIYAKEPGRELLWQYPGEAYPPLVPGSAFKPEDSSGFDDMFPTVNAEPYPFEPWARRPLPDHGEVWSMPWQLVTPRDEAQDIETRGSLTLEVEGRNFPYRLRKTLSLAGAALRVQYHVENLGSSPFPCLWAAHPLFATRPGMHISLSDANKNACSRILVANPSEELGPQGTILDFPSASPRRGGMAVDLSQIGTDTGITRKFYFAKPLVRGEIFLQELQEPQNPQDPLSGQGSGFRIAVRFPANKVPYLGIWVNEGGWAGQNNIGIEPATAGMDSPGIARKFGMEWILPPNGVQEWWLEIEPHAAQNV
jgi:galactose mutarotase-like enzyme